MYDAHENKKNTIDVMPVYPGRVFLSSGTSAEPEQCGNRTNNLNRRTNKRKFEQHTEYGNRNRNRKKFKQNPV